MGDEMRPGRPGRPGGAAIPLLAAIAGIAALTAVAYGAAGSFPFIDYDDTDAVSRNPAVLAGLTADGVRWAFTTFHMAAWQPLTWLSHMAAVTAFGADPGGHHLVNVALHGANAVLLLLLLRAMTGSLWRSAFAAALFAVHPLHVESVAWVAERKDVLSTFFLFLALLGYGRYARSPSIPRYAGVLLPFAASLLSKPLGVTFPVLLLVLDGWPLGRTAWCPPADGGEHRPAPPRRLLLEKSPFLLLSAASTAVTSWAVVQGGAVLMPSAGLPLAARAENVVVAGAAYLWKAAYPASLAVYYPWPGDFGESHGAWKVAASALLLAALSALAFLGRRRRPWLLAGWMWYLVTVAPTLGWLQVAGAPFLADRYTYVPLAGIFLALSWLASETAGRASGRGLRLAAAGGATALLLALALAARGQAAYWQDEELLFRRAVAVTGRNHLAWLAVGRSLYRRGNHAEAAEAFRRSLLDAPPFDRERPATLLVLSLEALGRHDDAEGVYRKEILRLPGSAPLWAGLARLHRGRGRHDRAFEAAGEAVRLDPSYGEGWHQLGLASSALGRDPDAVAAFRRAVALAPGSLLAWFDLGTACARVGDRRGVLEAHDALRRLDPSMAEALRRNVAPRSQGGVRAKKKKGALAGALRDCGGLSLGRATS